MPAVGAARHRRSMKFLLRIGIVAVFIVGGLIFRDRLGGSPTELRVGDCFDVPTKAGETVNDVQHHPCNESHTAEVILLTNHPAAKGKKEPSDSELTSYLVDTCGAALERYVKGSTDKFDLGAFYPTSEDWKNGDRGITCYLTMLDESPMKASFKSK
jgi:hypothetical protein